MKSYRIENRLAREARSGRVWLDNVARARGQGYKRFRRWVIRHRILLTLLLVGALLSSAWLTEIYKDGEKLFDGLSTWEFWERVIQLFAGVIVLSRGVVAFDRWMYFDPVEFAQSFSRMIDFPWQETYARIHVNSRRELDNYYALIKTPQAVEDKIQWGILVGKIADVLYGYRTSFGRKRGDIFIPGMDDLFLVETMMSQKLHNRSHQAMMQDMIDRGLHASKLASLLRKVIHVDSVNDVKTDRVSTDELDMLRFWAENHHLRLRLQTNGSMNDLGSQLSMGAVYFNGDVGRNCLSYMGLHSDRQHIPIGFITNNAGDSLATSMRCGLVFCGGDAGPDAGKSMTGGIIVIGGRPGNRLGHQMDDRHRPSVIISYLPVEGYILSESIHNGLIVFMNYGTGRPAEGWRFKNGQARAITGNLRDLDYLEEVIREYRAEWRKERTAVDLLPEEVAAYGLEALGQGSTTRVAGSHDGETDRVNPAMDTQMRTIASLSKFPGPSSVPELKPGSAPHEGASALASRDTQGDSSDQFLTSTLGDTTDDMPRIELDLDVDGESDGDREEEAPKPPPKKSGRKPPPLPPPSQRRGNDPSNYESF
jgi:hypothetical protein